MLRKTLVLGAGKHAGPAAVFHMRTPPRRVAKPGLEPDRCHRSAEDAAESAAASRDSELAASIKALVLAGERDAAREQFADLVAQQQRRAVRIAYNYLRDAHDADEAVQDAFVKVFTHITSYREEYPFEVWFTRILVNGCLDLRKARARRLRWALPMSSPADSSPPPDPAAQQPSPEDRLMSSERARQIAAAVEQLPDRQRLVFTLCHIAEQSTSEVSQALGLERSDRARASVPRRAQAAQAARAASGRATPRVARRRGTRSGDGQRYEPSSPVRRSAHRDLPRPRRRAVDEPHLQRVRALRARRVDAGSTLDDVTARASTEADAGVPGRPARAPARAHPAARRSGSAARRA